MAPERTPTQRIGHSVRSSCRLIRDGLVTRKSRATEPRTAARRSRRSCSRRPSGCSPTAPPTSSSRSSSSARRPASRARPSTSTSATRATWSRGSPRRWSASSRPPPRSGGSPDASRPELLAATRRADRDLRPPRRPVRGAHRDRRLRRASCARCRWRWSSATPAARGADRGRQARRQRSARSTPHETVAALSWMLQGSCYHLVRDGEASDLDRLAEALTAIIWHALYPDARRGARRCSTDGASRRSPTPARGPRLSRAAGDASPTSARRAPRMRRMPMPRGDNQFSLRTHLAGPPRRAQPAARELLRSTGRSSACGSSTTARSS